MRNQKKINKQSADEIKILKNRIKELDKFQDFFDNAPVGYHSFRSDRIIYEINKAELDMIGFSRDEIVGKKTWVDLILPEQKPVFEQHWKQINKTGSVYNIEYTIIHKNGHYIDVLLSATMIYSRTGKPIRTRGIVVDITDLKRTKKKLENSELILKKQKKDLEEKTVALTQVISQIEIEREKIKKNIAVNVNELIMPTLKKIRLKGASKKYIDLLSRDIEALAFSFGRKITDSRVKLAPREVEICSMVKNGLTSKEISNLLNISLRTVEKHRLMSRKKLGLIKKGFNLTSFLQSL